MNLYDDEPLITKIGREREREREVIYKKADILLRIASTRIFQITTSYIYIFRKFVCTERYIF